MKQHIVTQVRIRHHQLSGMPYFKKMPLNDHANSIRGRNPIEVPRSISLAIMICGIFWAIILAAFSS
jgi:hypothetical protein